MSKKSKYTEETKLAIVLEGLKNQTSIAELCKKYGVADAMYYKWKDRFVEGGKRGLAGNLESVNQDLKQKISSYENVVGRLTIQNELLKKTFEGME